MKDLDLDVIAARSWVRRRLGHRQVGADARDPRPHPQARGTIEVFGRTSTPQSGASGAAIERRWGVLFQQGALFSALTVKQNIQVPMREHISTCPTLMDDLAMLKIDMVG
jgi:ABC-type transporter Mla maintaining outer membrane lipid asymmetry ATPase subunit MlaF